MHMWSKEAPSDLVVSEKQSETYSILLYNSISHVRTLNYIEFNKTRNLILYFPSKFYPSLLNKYEAYDEVLLSLRIMEDDMH